MPIPVIQQISHQNLIIDVPFSVRISISNTPTRCTVKGLQEGLAYDFDEGIGNVTIFGTPKLYNSGSQWIIESGNDDGDSAPVSVSYAIGHPLPIISIPQSPITVFSGRDTNLLIPVSNGPSSVSGYSNLTGLVVDFSEDGENIRVGGTIPAGSNFGESFFQMDLTAIDGAGINSVTETIFLVLSRALVGNANRVGTGQYRIHDITYNSDNGIMYATSGINTGLYTINTTTGELGQYLFNLVSIDGHAPIAYNSSNNTIYMAVITPFASRGLYSIDLTNQSVSLISSYGSSVSVISMAYNISDDTMYACLDGSHALFKVNLSNGSTSRVGSATNFGVGEQNPYGLVYDTLNSAMYMAGGSTEALYILDTNTGVAERVSEDIDQFGAGINAVRGMAFDETTETMYMLGHVGSGNYGLFSLPYL